MSDQKRLFLVDAYALIFRGYYAFIKNPRINSKGEDTSAIMGFMNSLLDVIKRERPDHLAVCFDKGGSTDRVEMYEAYKANRDETPEGIRTAVPYIHEILKAMHIPIMVKEGYEADDVIGTLSRQAEKEGFKTYMVTPDKDFAQLVTDNVFMYRPVFGGGYETCSSPSKMMCSYTSSLRTMISVLSVRSCNWIRSCSPNTFPVGLCGVLIRIILVFNVIASLTFCQSIEYSGASRAIAIVFPPLASIEGW